MNTLESLAKLHGEMPGWIQKVDALIETANLRYTEFSKLSAAGSSAQMKKKKNGSTESLRPQDDGEKIPSQNASLGTETAPALAASVQPLASNSPTTPPAGFKVDIDPHNRHLFREVREQRRKRKNPSLKDSASGPQRFRSRMSLVIFYDSSIQEGFETLVRNVSGARNTIRRVKTAISFKPKLGSLKSEESPVQGNGSSRSNHMPNVPKVGSPPGAHLSSGHDELEVYDSLDKELETTQTLCEVGAHQFLRDGDCFDELEDTKFTIQKCMVLLTAEIQSLTKREEEDERQRVAGQSGIRQTLQTTHSTSLNQSVPEPAIAAVAIDGPIEPDNGDDIAALDVDLSQIPGRHQWSSGRSAQVESLNGDLSHVNLLHSTTSPNQVQPDDRTPSKIPVVGASVLPELDIAAASPGAGDEVPKLVSHHDYRGIEIPLFDVAIASDEPEIDLDALRSSVVRKRAKAPPIVNEAVPATSIPVGEGKAQDQQVPLDLEAMRASIGRRQANPRDHHVDKISSPPLAIDPSTV